MKHKNYPNSNSTGKLLLAVLIIFSVAACKGPQGDPGPQGTQGIQGAAGLNGNTIEYGTTPPAASVGNNGDFYINTSNDFIYGPKANGTWPAGVSLVGPQGAMGPAGPSGNTIDYGTTAPTSSVGNNGDFYINTTTSYIYGPKANGAWPAGASLIGPQGLTGASGVAPDSTSVGLIAFWKFDGDANDASGKGNNGSASNVQPAYDRFGRNGGAFYFDGAKSYVSVPYSPALQLSGTDYTINFWMKMQSFSNQYTGGPSQSKVTISGIITNGSGYAVGIGGDYNFTNGPLLPTGVVYTSTIGSLAASAPYVDALYPLDLDEWHMITLVYTQANGGTLKIFIDGYYNNSVANAGAVATNSPNPLYIGVFGAYTNPLGLLGGTGGFSTFLNGTLDDIRIYNQAISDTRIQQLKNDTSNE